MKKYFSMILFVAIMGIVSMVVLIGADALTKDRIAQNAELTWKSAILTHHEIAHTDANFATVFDETFEVREATEETTEQVLAVYVNNETQRSSFRFSGSGLWDVIEGVITLESDFNTIKAITVTKQGETPGLGGIVAEKQYLDKYVGKHFDETLGLVIVKTPPTTDYEVDAIVGATGTSNAFAGLLNFNYKQFNALFGNSDPLAPFKKALLTHNGVSFTNENYIEVFESEFTLTTAGDLTLYTSKSGKVSYEFTTDGLNGPIKAVITLESDFQTITKITVLSQTEGWGASIQTNPEVLAAFEGKKFNTDIVLVPNPSNNDNEVLDGFGTATTTKRTFVQGLNAAYHTHYAAFIEGNLPPVAEYDPVIKALLTHNNETFTIDNYQDIFKTNFRVATVDDLTMYKHLSGTINYVFTTEGMHDEIETVVTLASDFETIIKLTVTKQSEKTGAIIQTKPEVLAAFEGKKFNTDIIVVKDPAADNEVLDGFTGATNTKNAFVTGLNEAYHAYYEAFSEEYLDSLQKTLLTNFAVTYTDENFKTLFKETFTVEVKNNLTVYKHSNGQLSYAFTTQGMHKHIDAVITLQSDFETIVKITVLKQGERTGAIIQTKPEVLAAFEGKKFNDVIVMSSEPTKDNEVLDGFTGATNTKNAFVSDLNAIYQIYAASYKGGN